MNVQVVMEALGGGGHMTMAGAQLKEIGMEAARQKLLQAIDQYFEQRPKEKRKTADIADADDNAAKGEVS